MKNTKTSAILGITLLIFSAFAPPAEKLTSNKTHIKFFSSTVAEDIEAHNYKSVSIINTKSGDVVFSVPMQSFEFKKALMQKHFNSETFLDTQTHPKAKLTGKITNLSDIHFEKIGTYNANVTGEMTIHGKTNPVNVKAIVSIDGTAIKVNSKFNITLADYGVAFEKGKPASNIAKVIEVTVEAEYQPQN
jgi:polyisoprenoid-binding protein YceI